MKRIQSLLPLLAILLVLQPASSKELSPDECQGKDYQGKAGVEIHTAAANTLHDAERAALVGVETAGQLDFSSEQSAITVNGKPLTYEINASRQEARIETYITRTCKEGNKFRFTAIFDKRDIVHYPLPAAWTKSWMMNHDKGFGVRLSIWNNHANCPQLEVNDCIQEKNMKYCILAPDRAGKFTTTHDGLTHYYEEFGNKDAGSFEATSVTCDSHHVLEHHEVTERVEAELAKRAAKQMDMQRKNSTTSR